MIFLIGIYKITNLINNKSYIGQASNIEQRFLNHKTLPFSPKSSQYNSIFYRAIRKYGISNFSFEILEECKTEELDEKEIYWIAFYHTFIGWKDCQGYNMTIGGHGTRKISQEQVLDLWNQGFSQRDISDILSVNKDTIHKYLCNGNISEQEIFDRSREARGKMVNQYSLDGNFLNSFSTIGDAVKNLKSTFPNASTSNICAACGPYGDLTTAYGYIWKYNDDETPIEELVQKANIVLHHKNRPVHQFDLNGEYIQTFSTIKEAALSCGIKYQTSITNACNGRSESAGGYIWSYFNPLPSSIINIKSNGKRGHKGNSIAQYDLNGNLLKIYDNRQDAAIAINGKPKGISNVCCGSKKTYKGYIWKFTDQQ